MCTIINLKEIKSKTVIGYKVVRINTKSGKLKSQFISTKIHSDKVNVAKKITGTKRHSLRNSVNGKNIGFQIYKNKKNATAWMRDSNHEALGSNDRFAIIKVSGIVIFKCEFITHTLSNDDYHGHGYLMSHMNVIKVYG